MDFNTVEWITILNIVLCILNALISGLFYYKTRKAACDDTRLIIRSLRRFTAGKPFALPKNLQDIEE